MRIPFFTASRLRTARDYRSVETKVELKRIGFSEIQCRTPALLVPIRATHGEIASYQIRPDAPRIKKDKAITSAPKPRQRRSKYSDGGQFVGVIAQPVWAQDKFRITKTPCELCKANEALRAIWSPCNGIDGLFSFVARQQPCRMACLIEFKMVTVKPYVGLSDGGIFDDGLR